MNGLDFIINTTLNDIPSFQNFQKLECIDQIFKNAKKHHKFSLKIDSGIVIKIYKDILIENIPWRFEISLDEGVTWSNIELAYNYYFTKPSFSTQCINEGDQDQYASYFFTTLDYDIIIKNKGKIKIRGFNIAQINYISIQIIIELTIAKEDGSISIDLCELKDILYFTDFVKNSTEISFFSGKQKVPNPFLVGNPDMNCYSVMPTYLKIINTKFPILKPKSLSLLNIHSLDIGLIDSQDSAIPVYRLSKLTTQTSFVLEESDLSICATTYLFSQPVNPNTKEGMFYGIGRIKVPKVFKISSTCNEQLLYDSQYYSLSSTQNCGPSDVLLPFWTVNTVMMEKLKDDDDYVYIFWMPQSEFVNFSSLSTEPPIITWGDYRGYVLQTPSEAFCVRYKLPNNEWQGAPINAACYLTPKTNKPVTTEKLGEWLPSFYGDNFSNYQEFISSPVIGKVSNSKTVPWPISY